MFGLRRLEPHLGRAEVDNVAMLQQLLTCDENAIHLCAIGGTKIAHHHFAGCTYKLCVLAADVGVVQDNVVLKVTTKDVVAFVQLDALTIGQAEHCRWAVESGGHDSEKGSRRLGRCFRWGRFGGDVAAIHLELAAAKVGVGAKGDSRLAFYVVPLLRDVFAQGDGEFLQEGGLYVGKAFAIFGAELDEIAVGHHSATLGIDIALGIDDLEQFATELEGLDPCFEGTREETIKEVLH